MGADDEEMGSHSHPDTKGRECLKVKVSDCGPGSRSVSVVAQNMHQVAHCPRLVSSVPMKSAKGEAFVVY